MAGLSPQEAVLYGEWPSPISARRVARASVHLSNPWAVGDATTWLEMRPEEGGRYVVVRSDAGTLADVTPAGFSARSRVHEYGGGSYIVDADTVFFTNDADQRLYRQELGAEPLAITPQPARARGVRYADLDLSPDRRLLACVRERHEGEGLPQNELVTVTTDGSSDPVVVASGRDFYAFPRWAPDGVGLAFIEWDFPRMPWDGTQLVVCEIDGEGGATSPRHVAGGATESIFQPSWGPQGDLFFISDRTGWWNLYRDDREQTNLTPMAAEFAVPMWLFGYSTYAFLPDGRIACLYRRGGVHHLAVLDASSGEMLDLDVPFTCFYPYLRASGERLVFIAGGPRMPAQVVSLDFATRAADVVREADHIEFDEGYLSQAQPIEFETTGGRTAYAYHYPPTNPNSSAPDDGRPPPLVVHVHGGPTSEAIPELDLETQFFTSRGFALVDVNYGGSTGYGRPYRESLYERWGEVDVDDAIAAAEHLVRLGLADPERLVITGGSAGGWTTLCALTFRDAFAAGTSYFGVSDLKPFADHTHKFEFRYIDVLVGPWPEAADLWAERSPVRHADRLSRPLLILQGDEDEVVPRSQAEVIVEALESRGLPYAYLLFEGEQHGFRKAENIARALEAELTFYGRILGFEPADDLPALAIRNLPS